MELTIDNRKIFENFEIEQAKKMESLCSDSIHTEKQFIELLNKFNRKEDIIYKALEFAKSLDFSKNYLRSSYLSHPLRLTSFLIQIEPTIKEDYIVIALLHNVPETTEITTHDLKKKFNDTIASYIETLLVDRTANFSSIQESYYKKIVENGESLTLVKLIDKIDNLFVLCLNPDDEVRKNYILEVREKLLPFAFKYHTLLGKYLDGLLTFALDLGYSEKLKNKLTTYQQSHINK